MAVRCGGGGALPDGVTLRGLVVVHPYFTGKEAVGAEAAYGPDVREFFERTCADVLLKERGLWYHRELKASGYGGEVELFESKGVGHAFHFVGMAGSDQAVELLERNVEFIKK
ncbi:hypothetical protein OsI_22149 [Oryza sativa Indica Group]|uniref:Alpha/beta hydrolase fold-3 domain-containing protein n=1 Tax=Oryza sativa subsp. indica TaxID=39946 RepID=B8B3Z0_ORYSI|nr:hypothetical protein OsI_22149 [Oryza sativa Indica Group]